MAGLPYFDEQLWEEMASNSFAAVLKSLGGGAHVVQKPPPKPKAGSAKKGEDGSSQ